MPSFGYLTMLYGGVLDETNPTLRDTLILERVNINASIMRMQFLFDLHFSTHCRHAGRREGFLGTPPLAPRPAFSPFSLLPPPSLPLLPPLPRAWVWVGVGWEGGREEITLELINVSSTSRSLNALSTLARRSLDARSTSSRRHCGRGDDG